MSTLPERLRALSDQHAGMLKPEIAEKMERHVAELRRDANVAGLTAGDRAPSFALQDQHGRTVSSVDALARGPLVVSFFRGTWCPYCDVELAALVSAYDEIRAAGAELVTISPQSAANAATYLAEHPVPFTILVDPDANVAEQFRLAYTFPEYLRALYQDVFSNDLAVVNAAGTWRLPIPGRFVIDTDGVIADAQVDPDYRSRPDPDETVAVLQRLRAKRTPVRLG